jgi:hypothetical protein
MILAISGIRSNSALASVESSTTARACAEWANEAFFSPSPARDEAFVDCIIERDAASARDRLLQERGIEGLSNELASNEISPQSPPSDCAHLRVSVQSPVGSDEVYQRPMRDLFSAALNRSGFTVVDHDASHYWWASILAMETGPDSAVWTILVRAVPEIGDGSIQFTTVRRAVNGREGAYSGMQSLRAFSKSEAPEAALLAAAGIATELLPAAHRRCSDIDGALMEAGNRLEELQKELTDEILRVRQQRAEREKAGRQKQLAIEVEG